MLLWPPSRCCASGERGWIKEPVAAGGQVTRIFWLASRGSDPRLLNNKLAPHDCRAAPPLANNFRSDGESEIGPSFRG
jgi:hypothetical protein